MLVWIPAPRLLTMQAKWAAVRMSRHQQLEQEHANANVTQRRMTGLVGSELLTSTVPILVPCIVSCPSKLESVQPQISLKYVSPTYSAVTNATMSTLLLSSAPQSRPRRQSDRQT